jgi:gliding motility-associated-like protein
MNWILPYRKAGVSMQFVLLLSLFLMANKSISQITNPVIPLADLVSECPDTGALLPKIFLCGSTASRTITLTISGATYKWEQLNSTSCSAVTSSDCPNIAMTCSWTQKGTGNSFTVSKEGEYRVTITNSQGVPTIFYFNVYTNLLVIPTTKADIYCGKAGEITIAKLTGYEYSLDGVVYQSSNVFKVTAAGDYKVRVRRVGASATDCVFEIPVTITKNELAVTPTTTQPIVSGEKGTIKLTATNVREQYFYKITQGAIVINEVGPISNSEYSFPNLNAGTYTWSVKIDDCDWKSGEVTINSIAPFQITKNIQPVSCVPGSVTVFVSGGTAPYKYYFNGNATAESSNRITVPVAGTYTIKVVDSNNQSATIAVEVPNQPAPEYTIEKVNENCYNPSSWQIKFNVVNSNGNSIKFSIDNGKTFSTNPVFQGLSATPSGTTFQTIIEYKYGGVICTKAQDVIIVHPQFGLSAVAGVSELIGCMPFPNEDKAKIRITNPQGGTPPYQFSFDNLVSWTNESFSLHPPGKYVFYIKDSRGCVSALPSVTVENIGVPIVTIINNSFNCDGSSNSMIDVKTATSTSFNYTYSLDGGPFQTTNIFNNISSGQHRITVNYQPLIVPTFSNLLKEDFGYGSDTTSPGMSSAYCFERQVVATQCKQSIAIQDGDYSVTSKIVNSYPTAWYSPKDNSPATSPVTPMGRFLAVNVDAKLDPRAILYEKTIADIIPNQPIIVEFYVTNLLRITVPASPPNITIALVDQLGNEISTINTGNVPRNELWNKYPVTPISLNPGNNTSLRFIVRNNNPNGGGNDLAIDDISAYQIPKLCTSSKVVNFEIPTGNAFSASVIASKNISCIGQTDGSITLSAQNYKTETGYQYSIDNGITWLTEKASPMIISGLKKGSYPIQMRYDALGSCTLSLGSIVIKEPTAVQTTVIILNPAKCDQGATIEAQSTGGTPFYQYELWDEFSTTKLRSVQKTGVFDNISPGKYTVRSIDANGCGSTVSISVAVAVPPVATINSGTDKCYDSVNQATLQVDVDPGTGTAPFVYSLNGGALQKSNLFNTIFPGTYSIKVVDSNGCERTTQDITIGKELKATATLIKALDCSSSPDATIKVAIDGGVRPIRYQILKGNTIISSSDINLPAGDTSFIYTITEANTAVYSFNIIDANGCTKTTNNVDVSTKTSPKINSIIQLQSILCHSSSTAAIKVNLDTSKGIAPFTYSVKNTTTNSSYGNLLSGLPAGSYEVIVTDSNFCTDKMNLIITEPDEIKVTHHSKDITCGDLGVSKGSIIIDRVTGGKAPFNYLVKGVNGFEEKEDNQDGSKSIKFDVIDFGLYQINVVDSNGCSVLIQDVKVASPPEDLDIDVSTQTINCTSGGSAIVSVANANAFSSSGPFYFAIYKLGLIYSAGNPAWQLADTNQSTTYTGLIPGVKYTFIVYDETTRCYHYKTAESAISTNSTLEVSNLVVKNITCKGSGDGKVTFTVKNNYSVTTPISYQVYNSQSLAPVDLTSGTISIPANGTVNITDLGDLTFGNYIVVIKEAAGALNEGCSIASETFNIKESAIDLNLSATVLKNVNCNENGVISVQAKDGTAPYQYLISAVSTPTSNPIGTGLIPPPPPSPDGVWVATNSIAINQGGSYTIWVKDAYGCEKSTVVNVIKDPEPVVNVSLHDQCVNEGQFEIQIKQTNAGILPYYLSVNGSVFNPSALPAYILNQNSGSYSITIKDSNGCTNTQNNTIYCPLELSSKVNQFPTCKTFDGSIQAIASGGSGNYDFAISGSSLANGAIFSMLNDGIYNLKLIDKITACEKTITVNLEAPTPVTGISLTQKAVSCHGGNDGYIIATINTPATGINDNPIYKYSLNGGTPQESNIFLGLTKGTYTVEVISDRNCVATDSIEVTEPDIIVIPSPTVFEFGCNSTINLNNASITVSGVTGGSGTYTQYEFIKNGIKVQFGTNPIYIEADLSGGSYTINVYDDKGCLGSTTTSIQPFYILDTININIIHPISCNTPEEIQVEATAIGGAVSNIEYSLSPISGGLTGKTISSNSTGIFTGLMVGEYLITARNSATNCTVQIVHTVNEPNTFEISIDSVVDVSCYGGSNGSITLTVVDNSTPSRAAAFNYTVHDSLGNLVFYDTASSAGPITISNLKAAIYSIKVSLNNAPFCNITKNFTISQPTSALSLAESHSDITCVVGNNNGLITALPTGGWSDYYEFKWEKDGIVFQDWGDKVEITDLTFGNYTILLRDAKGCQIKTMIELDLPKPIAFSVNSNMSLLNCFADRSGTIAATNVIGGQGSNYSYNLNQLTPNALSLQPQISNEFKNLAAGTYILTIKDNWLCEATSAVIEIQEPAIIVPTLELNTPPTCMEAAKLELNIIGGTPPYYISSDNTNYSLFSSSSINGNIGLNHYFIKDNNGCGNYLSNDILVETPKTLSLAIDQTLAKVNCKGDATASLSAIAEGGKGEYSYILLDEFENPIRVAQTNGVFSNLPAGKYKIRVESNDCIPAESPLVTIVEPQERLMTKYTVTDVFCTGSNTGKIKVDISGGTTAIKLAISPNLSQFTETSLFDNLTIGNYEVIVQDALGCYDKSTLTINESLPLEAKTITSSVVQELCFDDTNAQFSISVLGGTLPYSVTLDNPAGPFETGSETQTQFDFTNLKGGTHKVFVQDANMCVTDIVVQLNESVKLNPSTIVNYDCVNNTQHNLVTVNINSSNTDFSLVQFALDGGVYQSSNVFSNLTPGDHFVRVKHNNGCSKESPVFNIKRVDPLGITLKNGGLNEIIALPSGGFGSYNFTFNGELNDANPSYMYYTTQDYLVTVQDANGCTASVTQRFDYIDICVPNYFTPNGDGLNDTWAPGCTINFTNLTFTVLDRYGRELGNYHLGESWDGKYQGVELPTGDYWYVLKLNNSTDDREFVGHFTLYR